jgi:hypothetical protein
MSQYCFVGDTFFCYFAVAVTCAGCAVADLVGRFKSGNRIDSILWGWPQGTFYILIVGAGLFALFASEALGSTHIIGTANSNISLAIVQASGLALATFIGLRTTVKNGKKIEIGPGLLFAMLLENVERRIDQDRTVIATAEIKSINKILSPRAVLNVVLPYCFDQAEKDPGDRQMISGVLEAIYINKDKIISPSERSALMLSHLHKVFGLSVLKSAIELVTDEGADSSAQATGATALRSSEIDGSEISSALESTNSKLDSELDSLVRQLSESK